MAAPNPSHGVRGHGKCVLQVVLSQRSVQAMLRGRFCNFEEPVRADQRCCVPLFQWFQTVAAISKCLRQDPSLVVATFTQGFWGHRNGHEEFSVCPQFSRTL